MASHTAYLRSSGLLAEFMKTANVDTVVLARAVTLERLRHGSNSGVSSQFIGRLRNGKIRQCSPDLAAAIETVLNVPAALLFDVRPKSSDERKGRKCQTAA